jgi:hypothetical protein
MSKAAEERSDDVGPLCAVAPPQPEGPIIEPDRAEGARLAGAVRYEIQKHILMGEASANVLTLWTLYTYLFDAFEWAPYIYITSPVHGCGKSTLRRLLERLTRRSMHTSEGTAASMFRVIHAKRPTFFIDEWDQLSRGTKENVMSILNSGALYDGTVTRCHPETLEPEVFRTFCPKMILGIGGTKLSAATKSRLIELPIQRAMASDGLARFKWYDGGPLRAMIAPWARRARNWAIVTEPVMDADTLRSRDVWEPLWVVAEACGPWWVQKCREAARELGGWSEAPDNSPVAVELLHQCAGVFSAVGASVLRSREITYNLGSLQGATSVTPAQLAARLGLFGIRPTQIRFPDGNARGYRAEQFEDPCRRYPLPPVQSVTPVTNLDDNTFHEAQSVTSPVTPPLQPAKSPLQASCVPRPTGVPSTLLPVGTVLGQSE